jgi:hypothetical protein
MMASEPPRERATLKETAVFFAKLFGYLAALAAFGFLVFTLRRHL